MEASAVRRTEPPDKPGSLLDPDAIAQSYLHVLNQPRSVDVGNRIAAVG
jgi:hypothetical protein